MTATAEKPKVKPSIPAPAEQVLEKALPEIPGTTRTVVPLFKTDDAAYFRVNYQAPTDLGRSIVIKSAWGVVSMGEAKVDFEKEVKIEEDWRKRA